MLSLRRIVLGAAAVSCLAGCSNFNGDRYALALSGSGQIVVLACSETDIADVEVWRLNDGKVVGDDEDELLATVGDKWEADGDLFSVHTGIQWGPGIGVGVTPSTNASFAAELGDPPARSDVVKFARGDTQTRDAFDASCK